MRLARLGQLQPAAVRLQQACAALPQVAASAAAYYNYGLVLRALGQLPRAARAYQSALRLAEGADTHNNLALVWHDMGLPERAHQQLIRALELAPDMAAAWCNLGNVLRDLGQRQPADAALVKAIRLDPGCLAAQYNRFATLYPVDPAAARAAMRAVLAAAPNHSLARYQLEASELAHHWQTQGRKLDPCDWAPSMRRLREQGAPHLASSLALLHAHFTATTRLFADSRQTLAWALAQSAAGAAKHGSIIELGVRHGHSLRFIAHQVGADRVHGFDSFAGLPAAWGPHAAGLYTTEGHLPQVPHNVRLHIGLFRDTLPQFVAQHTAPLRFVNLDCDIYASTRAALQALSARIVVGTVLVFDEYLGNPNWQQDEHRAFTEWQQRRRAEISWLAFSPFTRQAVAQVTRLPGACD